MMGNLRLLFALTCVLIMIQVALATLEGYDLVYKPTNPDAPRALLADSERQLINSLSDTEFSICFYTFLENHNRLKITNLFSYSSKNSGDVDELVLEVDFTRRQTNLYVQGSSLNFIAIPSLEKWTHLCISREQFTGHSTLFMNGVLVGSGIVAKRHSLGGNGLFILGQHQEDLFNGDFNMEERFFGRMTQFNVWSYTLSQNEVKQVHSCDLEGNVVSWSNSTWILYDDIQTLPSENPCQRNDSNNEFVCNNSTTDTFREMVLELKMELKTQLNSTNEKLNFVLQNDLAVKNDIKTIQKKCNKTQNDIQSLKLGITVCKKEIYELKNRSSVRPVSEALIRQLIHNNTVFHTALNALNRSVFAYEAEIIHLKAKTFRHDEDIRELKERNCSCRNESSNVKKTISDFQNELNTLKQRNAVAENNAKDLKKKVDEADKNTKALRQKFDQAEKTVIAMQQRNTVTEKNAKDLKQKVDQAEKKIANLQQTLTKEVSSLKKELKNIQDKGKATGDQVVRMT